MYSKIQIIALLSKFSKCEQSLGNNIINAYKKGKLGYNKTNTARYFIAKNILLNNNCLTDNLKKELLDVLQDICNNCQILVPIDPIKIQGCAEFSIITEAGECLQTENNNFIIQE